MTDETWFPVWRDSEGNRFLVEASRFSWPDEATALAMGRMLSPGKLGNDVEFDGAVSFLISNDGNFLMHHVDAELVLDKGSSLKVSIISGPYLDKHCRCTKH